MSLSVNHVTGRVGLRDVCVALFLLSIEVCSSNNIVMDSACHPSKWIEVAAYSRYFCFGNVVVLQLTCPINCFALF